ncbi:MAG: LamG domain-containing protein [Planctomycetes bacterium]|nr:LamG domain-containing protein [Planctomycetota bacterium]
MSKKLICMVCFVFVMSLAGNASADLVAHWRLDETSGTTALDSSGNGLNGTLGGDPQWVAGKIGGALDFDGDDYVDLGAPDVFDFGTEDFTITAWIKMTATLRGSIFAIGGDDGGGIRYTLAMGEGNNNKLTLTMDNDSDKNQSMGDTVINDGVWHHVVGMIKGDVSLVYVDGVEDGTIDLPAGYDLSGVLQHNAYIGAITSNASNTLHAEKFMIGLIDDVRIYDTALTEPEIQAAMKGEAFTKALNPAPSDGSYHEETWVNISWSPGDLAVSHDVYMGDDFDAVSESAEGTFIGNQAATFFVAGFPGFAYPDGLVPGTTYYWRIDEVNEADPNSPWVGDVWSFMIPPKTAYLPVPADAGEAVAVDASLTWTPGFGAKLHTVYFGDNFDDVDNAAGGLPQGAATFSPGPLDMAKTYYWRVDEFDASGTHKGSVWSFTTEGAVGTPDPAQAAVDVTQTPVLTWVPGVYADTHQVYFGADAASLELKGSGNLGSESYEPGQLEWDTTYYWRVDEANSANANSPWTGPLWSFTTANFLIIDDFEGYNDLDPADPASNRIFNVWLDGFGDQTNGSVVGNFGAPFAEQTIVHSGLQSMPMAYDNASGKSEATLTLTSNRDWTINGISTLTIWFRGSQSNAVENLYVALNGSAVVNHENPNAARAGTWTRWDIDLQAFADQGVNLTNVNSITLGLGNRANPTTGGSGIMYYDDIRLYAQ